MPRKNQFSIWNDFRNIKKLYKKNLEIIKFC